MMPQDLITYLPNGQAVCRDHRLRICPFCCLDLTYDDMDNFDEGDDGGYEDDYEEEDEDEEAAAQMRAVPPYLLLAWQDRCFILEGAMARFIPQWEESLVGGDDLTRLHRLDKDWNNPPMPNQPSSLSLHYCTACHLTWVGGRAGLAGLENHPSHHTLYHQYSGTSRSLMVFVDGACAFNGTPNARGGIGVYFGPNSPFNQSVPLVLQPGERATSQKAEIHAVITALRQVRSRIMPGRHSMCHAAPTSPFGIPDARGIKVVIATDSSYLVEAMCRHYPGWIFDKDKGKLRNRRGQIIEGSDGFRQIKWEVEVLTWMGVQVKYYQVPRAHNVEADALARRAT